VPGVFNFAGGGRSLERTLISLPIPVNRVINRESSQFQPLWNEVTAPYPFKTLGFKGFSAEIKKNYQGIFELKQANKTNASVISLASFLRNSILYSR